MEFDPELFAAPQPKTRRNLLPATAHLENHSKIDPMLAHLVRKPASAEMPASPVKKKKKRVQGAGDFEWIRVSKEWVMIGGTFLSLVVPSLVVGLLQTRSQCGTLSVPGHIWLWTNGLVSLALTAGFLFASRGTFEGFGILVSTLVELAWLLVGWISFGDDLCASGCNPDSALFATCLIVLLLQSCLLIWVTVRMRALVRSFADKQE